MAPHAFYHVLVSSVVWAPRMCSILNDIGGDSWDWDVTFVIELPPKNLGEVPSLCCKRKRSKTRRRDFQIIVVVGVVVCCLLLRVV